MKPTSNMPSIKSILKPAIQTAVSESQAHQESFLKDAPMARQIVERPLGHQAAMINKETRQGGADNKDFYSEEVGEEQKPKKKLSKFAQARLEAAQRQSEENGNH